MKPKIEVFQSGTMIDAKIDIKIMNLIPNEIVMAKSEMVDNVGTKWEAFAEFKTDCYGEIDLAHAKPLSGTYDTPDSHGLFWSMIPVSNHPKKRTPLQPLKTKLSLYRGNEIVTTTSITREVISSKVHKLPIREEGLVGTFFYHTENGPLPTVIVLGGSEGGIRESNAALLASYGFNTLALAYFGIGSLPEKLVRIPLEFIEKAIDWISRHPNVDASRLGVFGTSKGGELALLLASVISNIKATVGYAPSGVVYPGLGPSPVVSSWQYKGNPLPFAYGEVPNEVLTKVNKSIHTGEAIAWRKTYEAWAEGEKHAEIAVENSQGPILLISGGDDQLWPADILSERVVNRLRAHHYPYDYEHMNYPNAGHSLVVPGLPTSQSVTSPYGENRLLLGGTPKDNAEAQFDAWRRTVEFFKKHLNLVEDN